jgi:hypothetical protein
MKAPDGGIMGIHSTATAVPLKVRGTAATYQDWKIRLRSRIGRPAEARTERIDSEDTQSTSGWTTCKYGLDSRRRSLGPLRITSRMPRTVANPTGPARSTSAAARVAPS